MPRTDKNGRSLHPVLLYLLNRSVRTSEIYEALGIFRCTYSLRRKADDYPDAEELRLVARRFKLNPVDLQARFGLIRDRDVEGYTGGTTQEIKAHAASPAIDAKAV